MVKYVMRVGGWVYSKEPPLVLGYASDKGTISEEKRYATLFDTEAEAWEYANIMGFLLDTEDLIKNPHIVEGPEPVEV